MPRERMTPEQREAQVLADPEWAIGHALLMSALEGGAQAAVFLARLREAGFDVVPITPAGPAT